MLVSLCGVLSLLIAGYEVSAQPAPGKYLPMTDIRDLVLIYQGGSHRMDYNAEQLRPYVVHEDRFGNRDWLFDGFLFLEFDSGEGVSYHVRGSAPLARKEDWAWLVDRHFESGKGIAALDDCIAAAVRELGEPPFRHKVVIGIPEPPRGQKDWGELEGRKLDFSNEEDRIAACKWYADLLEERFRSSGFRHLELAGFYWLPEILRQSREVTRALGDYVRSKGLRFYWIPYYTAQGYSEWRDLGFDAAYLQPTYFWNRKIGDERVDRACELARTYGMGLEMEFDMRASVKSEECRRDRGMGYMSSFRRNGVYRSSAIAYYEGGGGVYYFTKTTAPEDRAFIDTLAYFIRDRRHRMLDGAKPDFRETFGGKRLDTASWNETPGGKAVVRRGRLLLKGTTRLDTRGRWDLQYDRRAGPHPLAQSRSEGPHPPAARHGAARSVARQRRPVPHGLRRIAARRCGLRCEHDADERGETAKYQAVGPAGRELVRRIPYLRLQVDRTGCRLLDGRHCGQHPGGPLRQPFFVLSAGMAFQLRPFLSGDLDRGARRRGRT